MPDPSEARVDPTALDRAVHEPARLAILSLLYSAREADFLFLQRETGLTQGNLSSHLAKLEELGHVQVQKDFVGRRPTTLVRLAAKGRIALKRYAKLMRRID